MNELIEFIAGLLGIQSIVEQDMVTGSHQLREGVEIDTKNLDQPLIIAEPDIQVRILFFYVSNREITKLWLNIHR